VIQLSDLIKNNNNSIVTEKYRQKKILICVLKMNESLMGL